MSQAHNAEHQHQNETVNQPRFYYGEAIKPISKTGIVDFGEKFPLDSGERLIITRLWNDEEQQFAQIFTESRLLEMLQKEERLAQEDSQTNLANFNQMLENLENTKQDLKIKPNSNRVQLPKEFTEALNLGDQVQIIGVGNRIEIINPEAWVEYQQSLNSPEASEELASSGF